MAYLYDEIEFVTKKEWSIDSQYNRDKPQKHWKKWKEPEDHIVYDSVSMKDPEQAHLHRQRIEQ